MNWFYFDGDERKGPISADELRRLAANGVLAPETVVQNESGAAVPARSVRGLFADRSSAAPNLDGFPFSLAKTPKRANADSTDGGEKIGELAAKIDAAAEKIASLETSLDALAESVERAATRLEIATAETTKEFGTTAERLAASLKSSLEELAKALGESLRATQTQAAATSQTKAAVSESFEPAFGAEASEKTLPQRGDLTDLEKGTWHVGVDFAPGRYKASVYSDYVSFEHYDADDRLLESYFLDDEDDYSCVVALEDGDSLKLEEQLYLEYLSPIIKKRKR